MKISLDYIDGWWTLDENINDHIRFFMKIFQYAILVASFVTRETLSSWKSECGSPKLRQCLIRSSPCIPLSTRDQWWVHLHFEVWKIFVKLKKKKKDNTLRETKPKQLRNIGRCGLRWSSTRILKFFNTNWVQFIIIPLEISKSVANCTSNWHFETMATSFQAPKDEKRYPSAKKNI